MSRQITKEEYLKRAKEKGIKYPKLIGEWKGTTRKTTFTCELGHTWECEPKHILNGCGCPYCSGRRLLEDFNSLGALYPELIKFFENREDAFKIMPKSNIKVEIKCPDCHRTTKIAPSQLTRRVFQCQFCGDGVSIPNKILRRLLEYFDNITDLKFEYKFPNTIYFYDASFYIDNTHFLIEMDGEFHYRETEFMTLVSQKERDKEKDLLAKEMGAILIRIPALADKYEEIKNSFENSTLRKYVDFSKVDWDSIFQDSQKNIIKEICEYYENDFTVTLKTIMEKFHLSSTTVIKYLKRGNKLGWCNYKPGDAVLRNYCVFCYDEFGNFVGFFKNNQDCEKQLGIDAEYVRRHKDELWPIPKKNKYKLIFSSKEIKNAKELANLK